MDTPRTHRHEIPLATRNSDVNQLFACPLSWFLKLVHEDEVRDATYFELGSTLHTVIQHTIENDLTLDDALSLAAGMLDEWTPENPIETQDRTVKGLRTDAERMVHNWFRFVHSDSEDRLPLYDDYEWPPKVEQVFYRPAEQTGTEYPVWGTVDALFTPKPGRNVPEHLIVDWKGSVRRQRSYYQLDYYRFGLGMPNAGAVYHYLDRERSSYVIEEADAHPGDDVVRQRILASEAIKTQILESRIARATPGGQCKTCVSKPWCPRYGSYKAKGEKMESLRLNLRQAQPLVEVEVAA